MPNAFRLVLAAALLLPPASALAQWTAADDDAVKQFAAAVVIVDSCPDSEQFIQPFKQEYGRYLDIHATTDAEREHVTQLAADALEAAKAALAGSASRDALCEVAGDALTSFLERAAGANNAGTSLPPASQQ